VTWAKTTVGMGWIIFDQSIRVDWTHQKHQGLVRVGCHKRPCSVGIFDPRHSHVGNS